MSRIAKHPLPIPSGVTVAVNGNEATIKGKLGEAKMPIDKEIKVEVNGDKVQVSRKTETAHSKRMWGTTWSIIRAHMKGVSEGFREKLELEGVGFRASVQGKTLVMQLGFSHDVKFDIPAGIEIKCPKQTEIEITGSDKQKVGQVAAKIYGYKPPEPYKGKGFRYEGQRILRKEGKKK